MRTPKNKLEVTAIWFLFYPRYLREVSLPVAARSKLWVCGSPPAECGFESRRGRGCLSLVNVVCRQVEVSATS